MSDVIQPLVKRPDFKGMTKKALERYIAKNPIHVSGDDEYGTLEGLIATANLVFDRKIEDMAEALKTKATLEELAKKASDALQVFPRGPMGLTPDEVKFSKPYQEAHRAYEVAAAGLRTFNERYFKVFREEAREHHNAMRLAKSMAQ